MVQGGPAIQLGVIVATVLGLWIGARALVDAVVRLARRFGLSDLTIGLTIVAMGTSTPELAVSVDATLKGWATSPSPTSSDRTSTIWRSSSGSSRCSE